VNALVGYIVLFFVLVLAGKSSTILWKMQNARECTRC